jgi:hypothetical protein
MIVQIYMMSSGYSPAVELFMYGPAYGFLYPALNAVILSRAEVRHRGKVSGILVMLYDSAFSGFTFFMGPFAFYWGYFIVCFML